MTYAVFGPGERSFPLSDPFRTASVGEDKADVLIYCGLPHRDDASRKAILVELGTECLGDHTGESLGNEGSNVLGFARYRNGTDAPSPLVELVVQTKSDADAIAAARAVFETAGLTVVVCRDHVGRIIDRLVRPKYNAALRFLDEGRASQKDMDLTCKLGLGYPEGPIERVVRGGLAEHYEITTSLFEATGAAGYAPARRSIVAARRRRDE
jgi:3-hydroxybutyryl-CoA dehydrogenase